MTLLKDLLANLRAGARLAFLRPVRRRDFRVTTDQILILLALSVLLSAAGEYLRAEPGATLSGNGVLYYGSYLLAGVLSLLLLARVFGRVVLLAPLLVVLAAAGLWLSLVTLAGLAALDQWQVPLDGTAMDLWTGIALLVAIALVLIWMIVLTTRTLGLIFQLSLGKAVGATLCYGALFMGLIMALPKAPLWVGPAPPEVVAGEDHGESFDWSPYQALDQERITYRQGELLAQTAGALSPERPGLADLYFIGFGGHAYQDVFMKEVMSVRALFDQRFDTEGRSLALINNTKTVDFLPLANQHNLSAALDAVAGQMNPEEDVLFLFLTSHGSEDHFLSTDFWPFGHNSLSAERLDAMLDAAGIKWRVLIVSACFSGGFVEPLKDPHSLIVTASRADRNSFGCGHLNDFTYFGKAYFDEQLRRQTSFVAAYHDAVEAIAARELGDDLTPSEPQMYVGQAVAGKLLELDERLAAQAEVHTE
ncbi:MAG: C13 family peptidase [Pseudomonadota bacterium]